MGEQHRESIETRIHEPGAENVRVFTNSEGVDQHYRQDLEDTLRDAGVQFIASGEQANLAFEGNRILENKAGRVVAFFQESQLMFAGALGDFGT